MQQGMVVGGNRSSSPPPPSHVDLEGSLAAAGRVSMGTTASGSTFGTTAPHSTRSVSNGGGGGREEGGRFSFDTDAATRHSRRRQSRLNALVKAHGGGMTPVWNQDESLLSQESSVQGGVLAHAVPPPVDATNTSTTRSSHPPSTRNKQVDDPHASLRALVSSTLLTCPTSSTLYASTLYTQTQKPSDAYLYAQTLLAKGEAKRAVHILDRAELLNPISVVEQEEEGNKRDWNLVCTSVVLACRCLATLNEWEDISNLISELFQSSASLTFSQQQQRHTSSSLHDEELDAVGSLVQLLPSTPFSSHTSICPVAQLCTWKGRAVEQGGNPRRAAKWLALALELDWKCVESWMYLCERQLLTTWEEERDLIVGLTRVIRQEEEEEEGEEHEGPGRKDDNTEKNHVKSAAVGTGDLTWLKDMCLAQLSYWSGMHPNDGASKKNHEMGTTSSTMNATDAV